MANLTITIDEGVLQAARIKALKEGTSVNEICRQAIARYAASEADDVGLRLEKLRAIARKARPVDDGEPLWPGREKLYEEMLAHRMYGRLPDAPSDQEDPPEQK